MHHRITNTLTTQHNDPFLNEAYIIDDFFLGMNSLSTEKGDRDVDPLSYKHVITIASNV